MSAKITAAVHAVMSAVGYVQKTGENKFHGYRYAGEADLLARLRPAMLDAGLLLLPSVKSVAGPDDHGNTTVVVEYTLAHKDGETWPEKVVMAGCGNDRSTKGGIGDKGVYKALTGANKYALFKLFQIETGDDPEDQAEADAPPSPPKDDVNLAKQRAEVEAELTRSAQKGTKVLKVAWESISPDMRAHFQAAKDRRFKPMAEAADRGLATEGQAA